MRPILADAMLTRTVSIRSCGTEYLLIRRGDFGFWSKALPPGSCTDRWEVVDGAEVRRVLADMAQLEPNGLRDFVATHGDFDLLRLRWVDDHHLRQHLERALEGALGRYQVLRRRPPRMRAAGARPFEAPIDGPVHPPARAKEPSLRTIELEHIYHDDDPLQAADFAVRLSDGSLRRGALNRRGQAVVPDVPDGDAQVQFGSDARLWELVSKDRNPAEQPDLSLAQIDALIAQQARNQ